MSVAAAGAATGLFVWNESRWTEYDRDFEAYDPLQDPEKTEKARLENLADSLDMVNAVSIGITALAAASAGTALYFWIAGDSPGKHEKAYEEDAGVSWNIEGRMGTGAVGFMATCRF